MQCETTIKPGTILNDYLHTSELPIGDNEYKTLTNHLNGHQNVLSMGDLQQQELVVVDTEGQNKI